MPLDREEDWQQFVQGSYVQARSGIYEGRIEPIAFPLFFNKPIIRISVRSQTSRRTWWLAGTLTQEIGMGMELQRWKIPLGRKSIIKIELSGKYRMRFDVARWLADISLEIDTYEGDD